MHRLNEIELYIKINLKYLAWLSSHINMNKECVK